MNADTEGNVHDTGPKGVAGAGSRGTYGRRLWQYQWVRDLTAFAIVAAALRGLLFFWEALLPLILALALAYVANPLLRYMGARFKWPRWVTATVLVSFMILGLAGFVIWLWPIAAEQAAALGKKLPDYLKQLAERANLESTDIGQEMERRLRESLQQPEDLARQVLQHSGQTLKVATQLLGGATYFLGLLFLVPTFFLCFCIVFDQMLAWAASLLPVGRRQRIQGIAEKMDHAVAEFFRGRLLVSAFMCLMFSLGWWMTGVPYWFILGILAGLANIVPYLSSVFWPLAVLFKYMEHATGGEEGSLMSIVAGPSAVFVLVQLFEGWVLTPWIQSRGIQLGAITVLIAVYIGGAVAGFWGLLLAIPMTACLKILWEEIYLPRVKAWASTH